MKIVAQLDRCREAAPDGTGFVECSKVRAHDGPHRACQGHDLDGGHYFEWRAADDHVAPTDPVNHPGHYTSDPSGVECITITRHRNFNVGNAIKYLWRAGLKESAGRDPIDKQIEDLRKAVWYIEDEIARLGG